jgi:lipopolysaccharide/colanic/teichoic acid biosynthesis glycosyltransferase
MTKFWKIGLLLLLMVDALALATAFSLAYWLRLDSGWLYYGSSFEAPSYFQVFLFSLPVFWILFYGCHLYDPNEIFYGTAEYVQVIKGVTFAVLGVIVVSFIIHSQPLSRSWLLLFCMLGIFFVSLGRFVIRRIIRPIFRSGWRSEPVLIVGASEEAKTIAQTLKESGRFDVVGFLDDFSPVGDKINGNLTVKGSPQDYKRIAREEGVAKLILLPGAVSWETYQEIIFEATKWKGLDVLVAPRVSGLFCGNLRLSYVGYVPMLRFQPGYSSGLNKVVKTFIDFTLGPIFFIFSLPLILILAAALFWQRKLPILESREVLGLHGKPFRAYKFRTGLDTGSHPRFQSPNEMGMPPRKSGKLSLERILATGLNKLPQLINVMRGQMSLVGPRTINNPEVPYYGIWVENLMAVKPGMTGPWAFGERDRQQEIATTISYIHTWTPWKDFQILCLTLFYLLQKLALLARSAWKEG